MNLNVFIDTNTMTVSTSITNDATGNLEAWEEPFLWNGNTSIPRRQKRRGTVQMKQLQDSHQTYLSLRNGAFSGDSALMLA